MRVLSAERWRSPKLAAAAIGLLVLGVIMLASAFQARGRARIRPAGGVAPLPTGYQGLIGDTTVPRLVQFVAVTTLPLEPGERIEAAMVERRGAQSVLRAFPNLRNPESERSPEAPLLAGYFEQPDQALGRFALTELPEGTPLGPQNTAAQSPLANPIDDRRPARFTIPLAPEPTLFSLLRPGDRVDLFLILPGKASRRAIENVRVVAINNFVTKESGLMSAADERAAFGGKAEAAQRKRARMMRERAAQTQGAAKADQPKDEGKDKDKDKPKDEPKDAAKSEPQTGEAKGGDPKPGGMTGFGEDVKTHGREFDGRAITVQVSPEEALLLSLATRTADLQIDLALRPQP